MSIAPHTAFGNLGEYARGLLHSHSYSLFAFFKQEFPCASTLHINKHFPPGYNGNDNKVTGLQSMGGGRIPSRRSFFFFLAEKLTISWESLCLSCLIDLETLTLTYAVGDMLLDLYENVKGRILCVSKY